MENIIPAVPKTSEKSLKELSPHEFQQLLRSWFEEKGIVQDMKSYLKFQMINVLKNTVVGKNIKQCATQTYSIADQVIHLIVAEYLIQNQCHFTLSLFTSEVNLTNILPQSKMFMNNEYNFKETSIFDKENLINILEVIGISKDSDHFEQILTQYFKDSRTPLLSCLIGFIGKNIMFQNSNEQENKTDIDFEDDFMRNVCQVLHSSNLSIKTQNLLLSNIKLCYDLKTKSFESECIKLVSKFKKELNVRDKKICDGEKYKRYMEKNLLKLQEDNKLLKDKLNSILNEKEADKKEKIIETVIPSTCCLKHCDDKCFHTNEEYFENQKKEIEALAMENNKQKEEIQRLNFIRNELLKEFSCCQSKINTVNTRIQEDNFKEVNAPAAYFYENTEKSSLDSDTVTEEILQTARKKLKLLEEESEELDLRFNKFVIK